MLLEPFREKRTRKHILKLLAAQHPGLLELTERAVALLPKWLLLSRAVDRSTTSSKSEQGLEEEDHIPVALHETKIMEDYESSESSSSSRLK